jgi:hypothetical protein
LTEDDLEKIRDQVKEVMKEAFMRACAETGGDALERAGTDSHTASDFGVNPDSSSQNDRRRTD